LRLIKTEQNIIVYLYKYCSDPEDLESFVKCTILVIAKALDKTRSYISKIINKCLIPKSLVKLSEKTCKVNKSRRNVFLLTEKGVNVAEKILQERKPQIKQVRLSEKPEKILQHLYPYGTTYKPFKNPWQCTQEGIKKILGLPKGAISKILNERLLPLGLVQVELRNCQNLKRIRKVYLLTCHGVKIVQMLESDAKKKDIREKLKEIIS